PTASDAAFIVSQFERLSSHVPMLHTSVFVLRSFTFEPIVPFLRARCYAAGIDATVRVGGFNTCAQELIDSSSDLYTSNSDVAILAVRTADIAPELWDSFADQSPQAATAVADRVIEMYGGWFATFREHSSATLLVHTLERPFATAAGVLDDQRSDGQKESIERINREIRLEATRHPAIYVLDYDELVARHGRIRWHDE